MINESDIDLRFSVVWQLIKTYIISSALNRKMVVVKNYLNDQMLINEVNNAFMAR